MYENIVKSLINDYYSSGKKYVVEQNPFESDLNLGEIEKKIGLEG